LVLLLATGFTGSLSFAADSKSAAYKLTAQNYCLPCEENKWRQYSQDAAKLTALDLYDNNDKTKYTHLVNVEAVVFKGSNWSTPDVKAAYKKAALVYAQCGIKLNVTSIEVSSPIGHVDVKHDLEDHSGDLHRIVKALPPAADYVLRDFRVRSIQDAKIAMSKNYTPPLAFANTDINLGHYPGQGYQYKNEIWVGNAAISYEASAPHKDFSVIAHEIGHVLLGCVEQGVDGEKQHPAEYVCWPPDNNSSNLMSDKYINLSGDLVTEGPSNQCDRMKNLEVNSAGKKDIRNLMIQPI
jgi:hypothetical protein